MAVLTTKTIDCVYYDEVKDPSHLTPHTKQVSMRLMYPNCKPWDTACSKRGGAWVAAVTVCQQHLWL